MVGGTEMATITTIATLIMTYLMERPRRGLGAEDEEGERSRLPDCVRALEVNPPPGDPGGWLILAPAAPGDAGTEEEPRPSCVWEEEEEDEDASARGCNESSVRRSVSSAASGDRWRIFCYSVAPGRARPAEGALSRAVRSPGAPTCT
jgi:hypothetical protein